MICNIDSNSNIVHFITRMNFMSEFITTGPFQSLSVSHDYDFTWHGVQTVQTNFMCPCQWDLENILKTKTKTTFDFHNCETWRALVPGPWKTPMCMSHAGIHGSMATTLPRTWVDPGTLWSAASENLRTFNLKTKLMFNFDNREIGRALPFFVRTPDVDPWPQTMEDANAHGAIHGLLNPVRGYFLLSSNFIHDLSRLCINA